MTASNKPLISLIAAAVLALGTLGSAHAQPAPTASAPSTTQAPAEAAHRGHHAHKHSPEQAKQHAEKRAEKRAERQAEFLKKLNLSSAQQTAWTQYQNALQPAPKAQGQAKPTAETRKAAREAWGKLTTPQRIEARQQQHAQRHAAQQARDQATLAFYAQLNPAQQQVFDAESQGLDRHGKRGGPRGVKHGEHHGKHHGKDHGGKGHGAHQPDPKNPAQ